MKMEPTVSSETSAIRTQTPGNYPKRNKLHLEHGEMFLDSKEEDKSARTEGWRVFPEFRVYLACFMNAVLYLLLSLSNDSEYEVGYS